MVLVRPTSKKQSFATGWRLVRYWYLKILRQEGTPEAIARGWACGVFAGSFPLFGLQTIIGLLLATILKGNKFTAAAGTWISNPFTYVPIFYFNFRVGEVVLQQSADFEVSELESWAEFQAAGVSFMSTMFAGCAVVGITLAIAVYLGSLWLTTRWQDLKNRRRSNNQLLRN